MILLQKEQLKYKYLNIYQDDKCIVVRILMPVVEGKCDGNLRDLLSDKKLTKQRFFTKPDSPDTYVVVAEGRYNRTTETGRRWWSLGNQIDFFYDTVDINKGVIQCAPISVLAPHETKQHFLHRTGKELVATIFCNDEASGLMNSPTLVICDPEGFVLTNVDISNQESYQDFDKIVNDSALTFECIHDKFCRANVPTTIYIKVKNKAANGTLYVKPLSGYTPKFTIDIINGEGSFTAIPLLLSVNESLCVHIGTHSHLLTECLIEVKD